MASKDFRKGEIVKLLSAKENENSKRKLALDWEAAVKNAWQTFED